MKVFVAVKLLLIVIALLLLQNVLLAQRPTTKPITDPVVTGGTPTTDSKGRPIVNRGGGGKDSLQKRDKFADSITIYYRYFDSTRNRVLDSSINDFAKKFNQPYWYINLGNYGTAARSLLFNPNMKAGWDAGFHQYDLYAYNFEDTRFFQTTRPYTELAYILASKAEQTINLLHTQNKKSNFNFALQYRFINSPGNFKNQNSNHNNIRFNAFYQTNNKKYGAYFIVISNKHVSSENGGLKDAGKLDSLALNNPFELETRLGISSAFSQNPFNTAISTGNQYKNTHILFRQYYDIGKQDSIVSDSTTFKIFYPRLRLQHTLKLSSYNYLFTDNNVVADTIKKYFNFPAFAGNTTLMLQNTWNITTNEFSIITFPEKNNLSQFLKVGAAFQNIKGTQATLATKDYNIFLTGEYRNRTRNQAWDIEATGSLYLNGFNGGDYQAFISLKRLLSKKIGSLEVGFQNVSRTPSFIFNAQNSFFVNSNGVDKKENTIRLFANYENAVKNLKLSGEYFLVNNYTYFDSFFAAKQAGSLFNILHVSAEKKFKLAKYFNLYTELHLQQTTGNPPVNLPLFLTRNRIAFEGNFFTNLFLSTGLELRYYTNYKADNYSPFTGQFFFQNTYTVANRPEVNIFMHFRIKSFQGYVRLENINTIVGGKDKYNFSAQHYPNNGLWFRTGIFWNFVN